MLSKPAAFSARSFSTASATRSSSSHSSWFSCTSVVITKTCSCMSTRPSSVESTSPRAVGTAVMPPHPTAARMGVVTRVEERRTSRSVARDHRWPILLGLMLGMGLAALDATIVATAVPQIVGSLGGFAHFPWLFSIYLLTQSVSWPIYGKLSDVFGRKPVLFFGIGMFMLGSVLCGTAWNMFSLIIFRGVQGIG